MPLVGPLDQSITGGYIRFSADGDTAVMCTVARSTSTGALIDSTPFAYHSRRRASRRLIYPVAVDIPLDRVVPPAVPDTYLVIRDTLRRESVPTGFIWLPGHWRPRAGRPTSNWSRRAL